MTRIILLILLPGYLLGQTISLKHPNTIYDVAISADANNIVAAGKDSTVYVYDKEGQLIARYNKLSHSISAVSFAGVADLIIASDYDGYGYLFKLGDSAPTSAQLHENSILSIAFLPDQHGFITTSRDNTAKIWNMEMKLQTSLEGHTKPVRKAVFVLEMGIVTVADDQAINIWSQSGQLVRRIEAAHEAAIWELVHHQSRDNFYTGDKSGMIANWDSSFAKQQSWQAHEGPVSGIVAFQNYVITAGFDGIIRIWNEAGKLITEFKAHDKYCSGLALSADNQLLVSAGGDGYVKVWSVKEYIK